MFHDVFQPRPASYAQAVANSARGPVLSSPRLPLELPRTELARADSFEVSPLLVLLLCFPFLLFLPVGLLWCKLMYQSKIISSRSLTFLHIIVLLCPD